MKKSVKYLVFSIMVICSILIVSVPFWSLASGSKLTLLSTATNDLPIVYKIGIFDSLVVVDDTLANEIINPTELTVKNRNGYKKDCKIYALVDKKSTISYEYLRVSLNDEIYNLNDIEVEEDEESYYFYLKDYELDSYGENAINTRIWVNQNIPELQSDSILITNIIVR